MMSPPRINRQKIMIEVTDDRRSIEQFDLGKGAQLINYLVDPVNGCCSADRARCTQETAAKLSLLIRQNHSRA